MRKLRPEKGDCRFTGHPPPGRPSAPGPHPAPPPAAEGGGGRAGPGTVYLVSARGGDRRGARGRARRSRARRPDSGFLALAGRKSGRFSGAPARRPSSLPARAPCPPGTSASFPFSPPARLLLSPRARPHPVAPGLLSPLSASAALPTAAQLLTCPLLSLSLSLRQGLAM